MFKNNYCHCAVFIWGLEIMRFYYMIVLQDGPTLLVVGIGEQRRVCEATVDLVNKGRKITG